MFSLFITIIVWVLIFLLWQLLLVMIVEPIREYKKNIGTILGNVEYYKPMILEGTIKDSIIFFEIFRKMSADLNSAYSVIPFKKFFVCLGVILKKEKLSDICGSIRFLSSCAYISKSDKIELTYRKKHISKIEINLYNQ